VVDGEQGGISEVVGWQGGGGFRFLRLGESAFLADGHINPGVRFATLAGYLWFLDTSSPHPTGEFDTPLLGIDGDTALVLLYNGILGDRRPQGGNVLTSAVWEHMRALLPAHAGRWLIYGEATRMTEPRRRAEGIEFRQIPYDIRMR
jgi:adenine-specific DNA-methyltransferase